MRHPGETGLEGIGELVWESRYRHVDALGSAEASIYETWCRVARALASVEHRDRGVWEGRFLGLLTDFRFLPGGRILAGAGNGRLVTLLNCFVMAPVRDSLDAIFDGLKEAAMTMQQGGGVGCDFSALRPAGSPARRVGALASGPVSFMGLWDRMCETLLSTSPRRGAMMATLRCDHPDVETFVDAKRDSGALRSFNCSLLVSDAFMDALEVDGDWPLVFPLAPGEGPAGREVVEREWSGSDGPLPCAVHRRLPARALWRRVMTAAYDTAEPGVLFIDRINRLNNLAYRERISATNPCGELPLPPFGACDLGALNLTRFVRRPFESGAQMDWQGLETAVPLAVRLLDNVIDLSSYPLPAQAREAWGARRIGLGVTGLADALIMLGLDYGSAAGRTMAARIMQRICQWSYGASVALARERGPFPYFDRDPYLAGAFLATLPGDLHQAIARDGIRNSHLITIAPAGTISLLAGNVSSGVEPVFQADYRRRMRDASGQERWHQVTDYACRLWRQRPGGERLPPGFVDARSLPPRDHLLMQAALQPWVDNAISKTVNVPSAYPYQEFQRLYSEAYRLDLKGCTTYREGPLRAPVLTDAPGRVACGPQGACDP